MNTVFDKFLKFLDQAKMKGTPARHVSMNGKTLVQLLGAIHAPGEHAALPCTIYGVQISVDAQLSDEGFRIVS